MRICAFKGYFRKLYQLNFYLPIIQKLECELFDKRADEFVSARRQLKGTKKYYDYLNGKILELLDPPAGSRLLDIFSGQSDLGSLAQKIYKDCTAIAADKYVEMLRFSPLSANVVCDANVLPFKGETFDNIFVCGGLHHLREKDFPVALKEIYSCLKPGGGFVMAEAIDDSPLISLVRKIAYPLTDSLGDREKDETVLTRQFLTRQLVDCGFEILSFRYIENVAYAAIGQAGLLSFSRLLARSSGLASFLIALDRIIEKLPFSYLISFGCLVLTRKPRD